MGSFRNARSREGQTATERGKKQLQEVQEELAEVHWLITPWRVSRCYQEDHAYNIKVLLPSKKWLLSKITDPIKIAHKMRRRKIAMIIRSFRKQH